MVENIESLVLEHLRHIRVKVDHIADDVAETKIRISLLEMSFSRNKHDLAGFDETNARQQLLIDRLSDRVQRIETRLDLISVGAKND